MSFIDEYLLKALLITIVLEELGLLILREKKIKTYFVCLILNMVTNPLMNILMEQTYYKNYYFKLFIFEVAVFIIEALVYYIFNRNIKKSVITSLILNSISLFLGFIFYL